MHIWKLCCQKRLSLTPVDDTVNIARAGVATAASVLSNRGAYRPQREQAAESVRGELHATTRYLPFRTLLSLSLSISLSLFLLLFRDV
jgi:hypothetical protein